MNISPYPLNVRSLDFFFFQHSETENVIIKVHRIFMDIRSTLKGSSFIKQRGADVTHYNVEGVIILNH